MRPIEKGYILSKGLIANAANDPSANNPFADNTIALIAVEGNNIPTTFKWVLALLELEY